MTLTSNAIEVRDVHKVYRRYTRRRQFATFKSALLSGGLMRNLAPDARFDALRGVSFDVPTGRTFGIIGRNGSGKSTMLKLIAGIGRPTQGTIRVNGRVSALIELGAGFHPEISGRENVYINGMMLGLSRREIEAHFDEIVRFAELEDFIDAPVKTYSSGMYVRLGFAVAIHVDPDVLLVDEVLAVGDEQFTHKCLDKFADLRRRGRTVLLVTHALDMVNRFCDEALWLDGGQARAHGDPKRVIDAYLTDVEATESREIGAANMARGADHAGSSGADATPPDMFKAAEGRWGSGEVQIIGVELRRNGAVDQVFQSGDPMEVLLQVRSDQRLADVVIGIGIFSAEGVCCYGTNTAIDGATGGGIAGPGEARFSIERLDLVEGTYKLDVAVHRANGAPYDYHRQLYSFRVTSRVKDVGIYRPSHRWAWSGTLRIDGLS